MIKSIVVGLLSMFVVLISLVAWDMVRMAVSNRSKIRTWRNYPRTDREHMALWLGFPLMKIGLLVFAGDTLLALIQGVNMSERVAIRGLVSLPFVLLAAIIQLWMIYSVRYKSESGDVRWRLSLIASVVFGLLMIGLGEFL